MNAIIEMLSTIILLTFTITVCIANAYKEEIWSYIIFEDEEDYEDDDLDEYYEQYFYLRVRNPFQT